MSSLPEKKSRIPLLGGGGGAQVLDPDLFFALEDWRLSQVLEPDLFGADRERLGARTGLIVSLVLESDLFSRGAQVLEPDLFRTSPVLAPKAWGTSARSRLVFSRHSAQPGAQVLEPDLFK